MKRAVYDKQFKMAAVKLAQETDKSVTQTAAELRISGCSLRRWINEYDMEKVRFQEMGTHFLILHMS